MGGTRGMADIDPNELDRADMEQLATGQDRALNALMDRHAQAIFCFLMRLLGNEDDASDLAQETFVRVYRARESYDPARKFTTWLYSIAANLARNHLRWRARHPAVSMDGTKDEGGQGLKDTLPAEGATPGEAVVSEELVQTVRAAVQQLPENLREVVVLCEWQDCSMAEAAAILGTTVKAVESRLYRARQLLRETLKPYWTK